ncbi:MAG: hypothetical protein PHP69_06990 [Candidatus Omnitrophica bacterium]|nr:hypothetical protein [Candidatus Omnitrophota bacterium]
MPQGLKPFDLETGLYYSGSGVYYSPDVAVDVNTPAVYYSPEDYGEDANTEFTPVFYADSKVDLHLMRNCLNRVPMYEPQLGADGIYKDVLGNIWIKEEGILKTFFHGKYASYRGTGKFRGSQGVYDENGILLNCGPDQGTFDYYSPYDVQGHLSLGVLDHFMTDVLWDIFSGSKYEPTPKGNIYGNKPDSYSK